MNDPVDMLIIGAGASGAWSLTETKMHILCVEQGGWMNPASYLSEGPCARGRRLVAARPGPDASPVLASPVTFGHAAAANGCAHSASEGVGAGRDTVRRTKRNMNIAARPN
ncbi:MAG TPA: hypothetical protein VHG27_01065, partial [Xanthobacteraceae bacterium]|nr:hypothetical protein [Xanthobacteraceae bacterium]